MAVGLFYSVEYSPSLFRDVAAVVGIGYLLHSSWHHFCKLTNGFHAYFLAPRGIFSTNLKQYGSWAVITGASEGIGRGYALELARRGLNVVLMSRSMQKLEEVAEEIKTTYGTKVILIAVDFSCGQDIYPSIEEQLRGLDIGILVNNVGLSYLHPDYFLDVPTERHRQIIEINCQNMVQMTHLILPKMLQQKKGIIVNLSSIADIHPVPLLATYGASKIFIRYFTDSLRYEYGHKGIIFQTVAAGMVTTTMSNARKVTFFTPDPIKYSRAAVATIGIQDYTHGFWPHALQMYLYSRMTCGLFTRYKNSYMHNSRQVLLRRKAEGTLTSQLKRRSSVHQ